MHQDEDKQVSFPGLTEKQTSELRFIGKWFLSEQEKAKRRKYIDLVINYWIEHESVKADYFKFKNPIIKKYYFEEIFYLRPISSNDIGNYITGLVLIPYALGNEKSCLIIDELITPVIETVAEYRYSNNNRNFIIDKLVEKRDTISVKTPLGLDTTSTRKALKDYINDKLIYPTEKNIIKLKTKFQLHQEQVFRLEYEKLTGQSITGFACSIDSKIVEKVFDLMINNEPKSQIEGRLEDFKAIFSKNETVVEKPIKWLLTHNKEPNKTSLFTFIKMMLELKEMPREILRHSNNLFVSGVEPIFPDNYTYPKLKEQKSSFNTHFKLIKRSYFPDFLK